MIPRVHITTERDWICSRLASHLALLPDFRVQISNAGPGNSFSPTIHYFLPYLFLEFVKPVGVPVALFTHYVPGKHQSRYDAFAKQVQHCIVLSSQHEEYLTHLVGRKKVSRVHQPIEPLEPPKLRVGWFHRSPPGYGIRKRLDLLETVKKEPWIELVESGGKLSPVELREAMKSVDCFLITSDYESGPASLLEGLALGKPVLIPWGVGLADEFKAIAGVTLYKPGCEGSLISSLRLFYAPLFDRYNSVKSYTADRWREDHAEIFRRILG